MRDEPAEPDRRLARAIGAGDGNDSRPVVLAPVPVGEPVGPPKREGTRLALPYPADGPFPPLPQPVRYKLVVGSDPIDPV